jgi:NitT/TauT family transport system substrate-binding protein
MQRRKLIGCFAIIASTILISLQTSDAAETARLIIAGRASSLQWPIFIGMAKGFFSARDINIDVATAQSTAATIQQVVGGSGDIGVGGLVDPIRAIDKGAELVLLRVETQIPPFSLWGKASIKSIKDLRGKTVLVGGAKDITLIYFQRMAAPNGLNPGDYDLVYAGTSPARLAALSSGAVDAAILYPPGTFRAAESGLTKLGDLGDYVKDLPFTGYAASASWAAKKPALRAFLQGSRDAVEWFYDRKNRTEAVDILLKQSGDTRGDIEKTYDYYNDIHIFPLDGKIDAAAIASLVKALVAAGDLDAKTEPQRFVDADVRQISDEASKH